VRNEQDGNNPPGILGPGVGRSGDRCRNIVGHVYLRNCQMETYDGLPVRRNILWNFDGLEVRRPEVRRAVTPRNSGSSYYRSRNRKMWYSRATLTIFPTSSILRSKTTRVMRSTILKGANVFAGKRQPFELAAILPAAGIPGAVLSWRKNSAGQIARPTSPDIRSPKVECLRQHKPVHPVRDWQEVFLERIPDASPPRRRDALFFHDSARA
jgi:hypothetical protein